MVGWHQRLDGHEFEQALRVGDGQVSLVCCSPWGQRVDRNEHWTELRQYKTCSSKDTRVCLLSCSLFFSLPSSYSSAFPAWVPVSPLSLWFRFLRDSVTIWFPFLLLQWGMAIKSKLQKERVKQPFQAHVPEDTIRGLINLSAVPLKHFL